MSIPTTRYDVKGMNFKGSVPSINTDIKIARGTKTAIPSAYPRNQLLGLAGSPLAFSSIPDPEKLRKFHDMIGNPSDGSDSSESAPETISRNETAPRKSWRDRNVCTSAVTPSVTFSNSLIRPASDMIVTPHDKDEEEQLDDEAPINITFATINLRDDTEDMSGDKLMMKGDLSPAAKAFVPSVVQSIGSHSPLNTMSYQPKSLPIQMGGSLRQSNGARARFPVVDVHIESADSATDEEDAPMLKSSVSSVKTIASKNGHSIPARPTLCALPPSLPRWAHSPGSARKGDRPGTPIMRRPGMSRMPSDTSLMTAASDSSDKVPSSWRQRGEGKAPGQLDSAMSPSRPVSINARQSASPYYAASPANLRPSSAFPMSGINKPASSNSAADWGIQRGSAASPIKVPKVMTPSGLLGAVPMHATTYRCSRTENLFRYSSETQINANRSAMYL